MTLQDLKKQSPLGRFIAYCNEGKLAYQVSSSGGSTVFFPRVIAPKTGDDDLEWRVSKGHGTVHATTVVHAVKGAPPYNIALIEVDEGFRMMSRVEDIDPMQVKIGMRVKMRMCPGDEKQSPYPVFVPLKELK